MKKEDEREAIAISFIIGFITGPIVMKIVITILDKYNL